MAFEFTEHMSTVSNLLWAITSAVGAGLCFLVLVVIAVVWSHPVSRSKLDRVSFRIVTYALVANMFFGISSAVGGMLTGPGWSCGFSIFVLQLTLQMSSFLLFTIALNLQLVVVNNVNGQRMEKYYIAGAVILSLILTIPPYAFGQYGWDPLEQDCWYTNDNKNQRLAWQIGTQMIWTAMTVLGEVGLSLSVTIFMVRHNRRRSRLFAGGTVSKPHPRVGVNTEPGMAPQILHATTSRKIILRIALYPLASCIVNLLSIITALHSTVSGGIHDATDYNILLLSDFLYGGRSIVYALLAASDPALVRGARALYAHVIQGRRETSSSQQSSSGPYEPITFTTTKTTVYHVELSTIRDPTDDSYSDPSPITPGPPGTKTSDPNESSDIVHDLPKLDSPTIREPDVESRSTASANGGGGGMSLARRFSWQSATRQNHRREEAEFKKQI